MKIVVIVVVILFFSLLKIQMNLEKFTQKIQDHHNHQKHINQQNQQKGSEEPCRTNLTDAEYLEHMIPHHQVAVDISYMLQKQTKDPVMQDILRKLIWLQEYEIKLMETMLQKIPLNMSSSQRKMKLVYHKTVADFTKPNKLGLTKTYCDPHFFDPDEHMKHVKQMKLTDQMYLDHMIPHHQVGVDMSKKLLDNTKNDFMIHLAYRIIQAQQNEIILLNDLLYKKNYKHKSELLL